MLTQTDIETLKSHALDGDGEAAMQLARIFDRAGQHDVALMWLKEGVANGHEPTMTLLGARLLVGRAAPQDVRAAATLIAEAASRGHAEACALEAMLATAGVGRPQSLSEAGDYLLRAAQGGHQGARDQLALYASDPIDRAQLVHGETGGGINWSKVRSTLDLTARVSPGALEQVSASPRILIARGMVSPEECRHIIKRAAAKLEPSRVNNPVVGGVQTMGLRTNTGMGFSLIDSDVVLQLINLRIASATGLDPVLQEPTNVLHYAVGQSYQPHFDFIDPAEPHFRDQLARLGQRVATCLIYLNDSFEGGETDFPSLNWRFKGQAGDALIFFNVDANGEPDRRTLHAGLAPTQGEKWLWSKWIRDRGHPIV